MKNYNFTNYFITYDEQGMPQVYSNISKRALKPCLNKNGYRQVTVRNNERLPITMNYARFLLILSLPLEDYANMVVDHINGDRLDDRLENLRWVKIDENIKNRKTYNRPHLSENMILIFDDGTRKSYSYSELKTLDIPYITLYTLAIGKEGKHYSKKHKVTVYYLNDFFKINNKNKEQ